MTNLTTAPELTSTQWVWYYKTHLDTLYGTTCCLCFAAGLIGNALSFTYFQQKSRDVPNTLYQIITINDSVICLAILPVGISFLSDRVPGYLFAQDVLCAVWVYMWNTTQRFSVFLVVVLSASRAYCMVRPFSRLRVRTIVVLLAVYMLLQLVQFATSGLTGSVSVEYSQIDAACVTYTNQKTGPSFLVYLRVMMMLTYILPVFVVAGSCIVSIFVLLRAQSERQMKLRKTRVRATLTILLFAAVYLVFNLPLALYLILQHIDVYTNYKFGFHRFEYNRQYPFYYRTFVFTLSVGLNSALNPAVYLWRMRGFRVYLHIVNSGAQRRLSTVSGYLRSSSLAARRETVRRIANFGREVSQV